MMTLTKPRNSFALIPISCCNNNFVTFTNDTSVLVDLLPEGSKFDQAEQSKFELLNSDLSIEQKQKGLIELNESSFLINGKRLKSKLVLKQPDSAEVERLLGAVECLIESFIVHPIYPLIKKWLGSNDTRIVLATILYNSISLLWKSEWNTKPSGNVYLQEFMFAVSDVCLPLFFEAEACFLEDNNSSTVIDISLDDHLKHMRRRERSIISQMRRKSLNNDELADLRESKCLLRNAIESRSSMSYTDMTPAGISNFYNVITLRDRMLFALFMVDVLLKCNLLIKFGSHRGKKYLRLHNRLININFFQSMHTAVDPLLIPNGFDSAKVNVSSTVCANVTLSHERQQIMANQSRQGFAVDYNFLLDVLHHQDIYLRRYLNGRNCRPELVRCLDYTDIDLYIADVPGDVKVDIWIDHYLRFVSMVWEFYQLVKKSILFCNSVLYFPLFSDFRGRLYMTGFPVNPTGSKSLHRKFIQFTQDDSGMVEYDAKAQALQLYGVLSGDLKAFFLTGLVDKNDALRLGLPNDVAGNVDIYEYVAAEYRKIIRQYYLESDEIQLFCDVSIIEDIIDIVTDRKILKNMVMAKNYSEGIRSRANKLSMNQDVMALFDGIPNPVYYDDKRSISCDKHQVLWRLSALLDFVFDEALFPEIAIFRKKFVLLCKTLQKLNGQNDSLTLSWDRNFSSGHFYKLFEPMSVDFGNGIQHEFNIPVVINSDNGAINARDSNKFWAAVLPNLIHCLDSCIMFGVLDRCHKKQIDVMPIHDAFYVLGGDLNKQFVNKSYADSILQLFENDPIRLLVARNGVDWNSIPVELRDYFDSVHSKRSNILLHIKQDDILG